MRRTQQGLPQHAEVVSLLNDAYGGWGSQPYFHWKYELYPDYDPDTQTFYSTVEGELAAFRRVFYKEVVDGARTNTVFVLGDTAVDPAHQGEGLYSELHTQTVDFSRNQGADRIATFNRKTNLTFEANQSRGWQYRELPLKIRLLSPDRVLEAYADLVVPELPAIETVAERIGDRLHIRTSNGPVSLRDCVSTEPSTGPTSQSIGPSVSDRTLAQLIDLACSTGQIEPLSTLVEGWVNPENGSRAGASRSADSTAYQIHRRRDLSTAEFDEIVELYGDHSASFRRTPADIRHILQYPDSDILLATDEDGCVGYAVVGPRSNGGLREGRVLELRADQPAVFELLIDEIEQLGVDRGYDILLVFADRSMDELWASVDQQVIMWWDLATASPPLVESCEISLYDVV